MTVPVPAIGDGRSQSKVTGLNWRLTYWSRKGSKNNQNLHTCQRKNAVVAPSSILPPTGRRYKRASYSCARREIFAVAKLPTRSLRVNQHEWMNDYPKIHSFIHPFIHPCPSINDAKKKLTTRLKQAIPSPSSRTVPLMSETILLLLKEHPILRQRNYLNLNFLNRL